MRLNLQAAIFEIGPDGIVKGNERLLRVHAEVDGVLRRVALAHEVDLALLERAGHVHLRNEAQEERACIRWQAANLLVQGLEIDALKLAIRGQADCSHACAAVAARHRHAVHVCLVDAGKVREALRDVVGRDVLALPAERVADAVLEVVEPLVIDHQQIARTKPQIALAKNIPQDLLLCCLLVRVAIEVPRGVAPDDPADDLTGLARLADHAAAVNANGHLGLMVVLDNVAGHKKIADGRNEANSADARLVVEKRDVALGRGIQLADGWDAEPLGRLLPDIRAKAVAKCHADLVAALLPGWLLVDEIAQDLADVLDDRAPVGDTVPPELRCRELASDNNRASKVDRAAHADAAARAVVQRQRAVDAVVVPQAGQDTEADGRHQEAAVRKARRLGQPGGAARVDQEENVAGCQVLAQCPELP
eukprot:m.42303 g.42303  ORF g.42303 m.42303 type:complete len:421 (-) comp5715_c0_seq1:700-1962(-)